MVCVLIMPEAGEWADVVRVIDIKECGVKGLILNANTLEQKAVCYLEPEEVKAD